MGRGDERRLDSAAMSPRSSILVALAALQVPAAAFPVTPDELWRAWPTERYVTTEAPCLLPDELGERLTALAVAYPDALALETVGRSVQGRPIHLLSVGDGPREVLLWSQMHGDEPSATPALLDLAAYLARHGDDPDVAAIRRELTLRLVPMLNPDGALVYTRHNAQGIDVNRDALALATPEGRLLKALRERFAPILGFNLHDQNRRRTAGTSGILATNAVLAVAGDERGTLTPGRERAQRAAAAIAVALAPHFPGGMARYDETFSPRSFGDNLTAWGTPVVLIESGGLPPGRPWGDLARTQFVGILAALAGLAHDDLAGYDPEIYRDLPDNEVDEWTDVVVRGGEIWQPAAGDPYRADLAFEIRDEDRRLAGCAGPDGATPGPSRIFAVGDARLLGSGRDVDAEGQLVVPAFTVAVDGWGARRWLDAELLDRLARRGVATVRWRVPARRLLAAEELAAALAAPGRPTLAPTANADDGLARLDRRELARLDDGDTSTGPLLAATAAAELAALYPRDPRPPLRERRPASFLLLGPGDGGITARPVVGVWIDGREVTAR